MAVSPNAGGAGGKGRTAPSSAVKTDAATFESSRTASTPWRRK